MENDIISQFSFIELRNYIVFHLQNRRVKSALKMENDIISQFDKTELLSVLQRNDYHSPEISESEDEFRSKLPSGKNFVHVYDYPWHSDMVNIYTYIIYFGQLIYFIFIFYKIVEQPPS